MQFKWAGLFSFRFTHFLFLYLSAHYVPISIFIFPEERGKEHLWRSANNGTETHTSSLDEYVIGQLYTKDFIEALERSDRSVPLPSMGWLGSYQSATFLSHNSACSTSLGCGALVSP